MEPFMYKKPFAFLAMQAVLIVSYTDQLTAMHHKKQCPNQTRQGVLLTPTEIFSLIKQDNFEELRRRWSPNVNQNLLDETGKTPLEWACYLGHANIVEFLLKQPCINHNNEGILTISIGGNSHHNMLEKLLIDTIVGFCYKNINCEADYKNYFITIKCLLAKDADPFKLIYDLFHNPAFREYFWLIDKLPRLLQELVRDYFPVEFTLVNHNTELHMAALLGNLKLCQDLIQANLEAVMAINDFGQTPLHAAVLSGDIETIGCLCNNIRLVRDKSMADHGGSTAVDYAISLKRSDLLDFLASHGCDMSPTFHSRPCATPEECGLFEKLESSNNGASQEISRLVTSGNSRTLRIHNASGWNLLHCVAQSNDGYTADCLVCAGIGINWMNGDNETPLHIAVGKSNPFMVDVLLRLGANQCVRSSLSQQTPLRLAIEQHNAWLSTIVEELQTDLSKQRRHDLMGKMGDMKKIVHVLIRNLIKKQTNNVLDCSICARTLNTEVSQITISQCGHFLCSDCFIRFQTSNLACPICRCSPLTPDLLISLTPEMLPQAATD